MANSFVKRKTEKELKSTSPMGQLTLDPSKGEGKADSFKLSSHISLIKVSFKKDYTTVSEN